MFSETELFDPKKKMFEKNLPILEITGSFCCFWRVIRTKIGGEIWVRQILSPFMGGDGRVVKVPCTTSLFHPIRSGDQTLASQQKTKGYEKMSKRPRKWHNNFSFLFLLIAFHAPYTWSNCWVLWILVKLTKKWCPRCCCWSAAGTARASLGWLGPKNRFRKHQVLVKGQIDL